MHRRSLGELAYADDLDDASPNIKAQADYREGYYHKENSNTSDSRRICSNSSINNVIHPTHYYEVDHHSLRTKRSRKEEKLLKVTENPHFARYMTNSKSCKELQDLESMNDILRTKPDIVDGPNGRFAEGEIHEREEDLEACSTQWQCW